MLLTPERDEAHARAPGWQAPNRAPGWRHAIRKRWPQMSSLWPLRSWRSWPWWWCNRPTRCEMGNGSECRIFLVGGTKGMECDRFTSLHGQLVGRQQKGEMYANWVPHQRFPDCLLPEES